MQAKEHWEKVYKSKSTDSVSWFQEHALCSLQLIRQSGVELSATIIDVGGGASTLVDDLLSEGYCALTVLDISATAIAAAQSRLGAGRCNNVQWLEADILTAELPDQAYDIWHDRAVFHFLASSEERQKYVQALKNVLKPGGSIIIATFAVDGPIQCSGLPAMRYSADTLHAELGDSFTLVQQKRESHVTPSGVTQQFLFCFFRYQPDFQIKTEVEPSRVTKKDVFHQKENFRPPVQ